MKSKSERIASFIKLFSRIVKIMSTHLSMPLYYYDDNGYKIGPINKKELYALAEKGAIQPETRLTDDKVEIKAKNIPKLKFGDPEIIRKEELFDPKNYDFNEISIERIPVPVSTTKPPHTTYAQESATTAIVRKFTKISMFSWLTDFTFQNIQLPTANLWGCRIIYGIHCFAAILYGILVTILGHSKTNSILFDFTIKTYNYLADGIFPILISWIIIFLSIITVRKSLEWEIMLIDWIVAATKSAKQHIKDNSKEQKNKESRLNQND
jgi:hypothetical protein